MLVFCPGDVPLANRYKNAGTLARFGLQHEAGIQLVLCFKPRHTVKMEDGAKETESEHL